MEGPIWSSHITVNEPIRGQYNCMGRYVPCITVDGLLDTQLVPFRWKSI